MQDFKGRVAVITGAANGIGLGLAEALAAEGCKLVLADIETEALEAVAARLRTTTEAIAVPCDVAHYDQVEALAKATEDAFGGAQLVFANAGVTTVGRPTAALSMNDWSWILGTNLFGVIHTVQAFMPMLKREHEAAMVITASGVCAFMGVPLNAPYCASKAAVISYAETLYREHTLAKSPVGIHALCPGAVIATLHRSEDRRPASLPDLCETDPAPPGFRQQLEAIRGDGLTAAQVAQMTLEGIRAGKLYIMTHPENAHMVEARGLDASAGRNPQMG